MRMKPYVACGFDKAKAVFHELAIDWWRGRCAWLAERFQQENGRAQEGNHILEFDAVEDMEL